MNRVYNFSAGPAAMPLEVLEQAQRELTCWGDTGASVMELSHRGKPFVAVAEQAEQDLRTLLGVPDDYAVLFLQGGATGQFNFIPQNLLGDAESCDYINTGQWSKKAIAEAQKFARVNVAGSSESDQFSVSPSQNDLQLDSNAAYLHYTPNETIGGVEFSYIPDAGDVPLVADFSSTILSRPLDVSRFGLIYAGAQKNIGPSGLTVVIVRKSLFGRANATLADAFNYEKQAAADSMLNTPPTYGWYIAGLVFKWLLDRGGLEAMAQVNERKAAKLYRAIDASDYYRNPVDVGSRSWMNVPFICGDGSRDKAFLEQSEAAGLHALKGHRSVGGMRASIYNAMPEAGVDALIDFMAEFERVSA
jgi:phosphoserine aminotransferase